MKRLIIILYFCLLSQFIFSQQQYQIIKIDSTSINDVYFIYIQSESFLKNRVYRIASIKRDTIIEGNKIEVGDLLKLKLKKAKKIKNFKDSFVPKNNEDSFFYKDFFEGKEVILNYYSKDFIGLYHLNRKD